MSTADPRVEEKQFMIRLLIDSKPTKRSQTDCSIGARRTAYINHIPVPLNAFKNAATQNLKLYTSLVPRPSCL